MILAAFAGFLAMAGCANTLLENTARTDSTAPSGSAETGLVTVSIGTPDGQRVFAASGSKAKAARTLFPDMSSFTRYEVSFSGPGTYPDEKVTEGTSSFELIAGEWTITATAFIGAEEPYAAAASGSTTITVAASTTTPATIILKPVLGGTGTFSYAIGVPANTSGSLTFTTAEDAPVEGGTITLTAGTTNTGSLPSLASGYYQMNVRLEREGRYTGRTEIVHIYPALTTMAEYMFGFAVGEFAIAYTVSGVITASDSLADLSAVSIQLKKGGSNVDTAIHPATDGAYSFAAVPEGNDYTIEVTLAGYYPRTFDVFEVYAAVTGKNRVLVPDSMGFFTDDTIGNVAAYLNGATGGTTIADPIGVYLEISSVASLTTAYNALPTDKYAAYDLSGSTLTTLPPIDSVSSVKRQRLAAIALPDTLQSIVSKAFYGCTSLAVKNIPDSVTSIGEYAFYNCANLTEVTISDGVPSIGNSTFYGCTSLTTVTIPDSITSIGGNAFYGSGLTEVTIPNTAAVIGDNAFSNCTALESATVGTTPDFLAGSNSMFYGCTNLKTVVFTGTNIGDYTLYGRASVTSVTIPDSVTSIGRSAFYNTGLSEITIPDSVTAIGNTAFSNCAALESATVGTTPDFLAGSNSMFYGCANLKTVVFTGTSIGKYTLYSRAVTSVTISDSVTSIGDYAFDGCTSLAEITIPDSVTSIGDNAFYRCTSLAEITIPDSVTSIGDYAFRYCISLSDVTIPNSVTSIGNSVFFECSGLESATVGATPTSSSSSMFRNCTNLETVIFTGTRIGDYTLSGNESVTSITISDTVTIIGMNAFASCKGLTEIIIPNSVTSIGSYAFMGCTGLTAITIPDSVTGIGYYTFSGCTNLTAVIMQSAVPPMLGFSGGSSYTFNNTHVSLVIKVSFLQIAAYTTNNNVSGWEDYKDMVVVE
jgi:hypothetical protein